MNQLLHGRYDFEYFIKEILQHEFANHHQRIMDNMTQNKRSVTVIPRGHGKTFMAIDRALHYITYHENKQVVIISSSREQSTKVLETMKTVIKDTPTLHFLKPDPTIDEVEEWEMTWSRLEIATSTGCRVFVRPFNSAIRGLHVDLCICDDVLRDDKKVLSDERAKYIFFNVVSPIVNTKKGDIAVLGTLQADTDLLMQLMKIDGYSKLHLSAVINDQPLWPERFSMEDLKRIREEIGAFAYTQEYLCQIISDDTSWFNTNDIKAAIGDCLSNKPKDGWNYYLGVDVAMSEATTADYSVFTVIGYNYETDFYEVTKIIREKGLSTKQHIERIEELDKDYDLDTIWIESNSIAQGVVREATDKWPNKAEGFHTGGKNKPEILGHLEAAFNKGIIKIPNNQTLITELMRFRAYKKGDKYKIEGVGAHDDMVMSLAIAYENALENNNQISVGFI